MYLKDNDATTFDINPGHDDHTKFRVPGPAVYAGSDSVAGDPSGAVTDDLIPCNCEGGDSTTPEAPASSKAPAAPAPSVTPPVDSNAVPQNPPDASGTDCGAAFVRDSSSAIVNSMLMAPFNQTQCQKDHTGDPAAQLACGPLVRLISRLAH